MVEPTETECLPRPWPQPRSNTATTNYMVPFFFYLSVLQFLLVVERLEYDAS